MITDGLSCKGSYHDINQDSFICKPVSNGYMMALSDGMGSKRFSQFGSRIICEVLEQEFENEKVPLDQLKWIPFLKKCHAKWIENLKEYDITQCYATMLVLLIQDNCLKAARLGDGFLSILIPFLTSCDPHPPCVPHLSVAFYVVKGKASPEQFRRGFAVFSAVLFSTR